MLLNDLFEVNIHSPAFKDWFGDSKIVDSSGKPLKLYRGLFGPYASNPHDWMNPRKGYAAFFTPSPWVASSYATPSSIDSQHGAVYPVYIKAHKLIEFPAKEDEYGRRFDMFAFDDRARILKPGEVIVVRNVCDIGPRASWISDPEKNYSRPTDIYGVGRGTEIRSAISENITEAFKAYSLTPAVWVKGKAYTGKNHLDALNKSGDQNAVFDANNRGFVTEKGRYLDRYQAQIYALQHDLIDPRYPWALTARELTAEVLKSS